MIHSDSTFSCVVVVSTAQQGRRYSWEREHVHPVTCFDVFRLLAGSQTLQLSNRILVFLGDLTASVAHLGFNFGTGMREGGLEN